MGKQSMGQRLRRVDRTPVHPDAAALVWHPYLLDNAEKVAAELQRHKQDTTPAQALSVLLRKLIE